MFQTSFLRFYKLNLTGFKNLLGLEFIENKSYKPIQTKLILAYITYMVKKIICSKQTSFLRFYKLKLTGFKNLLGLELIENKSYKSIQTKLILAYITYMV
ncbi:hypothetical protein AB674_00440 [Flavobacterium sp. ABG]|nr:hypothetical protein AB674_00440 [Flavobacterium sp. ABG]